MKASDIFNKAKQEIIDFANFEMANIKSWLVSTGVWEDVDKETWEYSPYWFELADFGKELSIFVAYADTHTLETFQVSKKVKGFQFDIDKNVLVVLEDMDLNEEDGIYLRALEIYEIVKIANLLEETWLEIIHQKL